MIATVRGEVEPGSLGVVDAHEHLFARPRDQGLLGEDPDLDLTDPAGIGEDVQAFKAAGGRTIVDWTTVDYGRDVRRLREIASEHRLNVIAITGFNKGRHCRPLCEGRSPDELAAVQIREVERGVGETGIRVAAVKFGTGLAGIDPWEETAGRAAALTHLATGCPVLTHTERGTLGRKQLSLLGAHGVEPSRVLLAHLDHNPELDQHLRLAATGASIGYDQVPKAYHGTASRAERFLVELARRGLHTQVVLGGDFARRSLFRGLGGGPGLDWILTEFRSRLRRQLGEHGLNADDVLEQVLVHNPARLLSRDRS